MWLSCRYGWCGWWNNRWESSQWEGPTVYGYTKGGGYGWSGNASAGLINVGDPYSGAGGNNQTVGGSGKAYGTTTIGGGVGSIVTPGHFPGNPGWVNVYYTH